MSVVPRPRKCPRCKGSMYGVELRFEGESRRIVHERWECECGCKVTDRVSESEFDGRD